MILRLVFQLLRAEKDYYVQICLGSIQNYEKNNKKGPGSDLMTSREQKNIALLTHHYFETKTVLQKTVVNYF